MHLLYLINGYFITDVLYVLIIPHINLFQLSIDFSTVKQQWFHLADINISSIYYGELTTLFTANVQKAHLYFDIRLSPEELQHYKLVIKAFRIQ